MMHSTAREGAVSVVDKRGREIPKGITCTCGATYGFPGYVYAHWDIPLTFTCGSCGAQYAVLQGRAIPRNPRPAKFDGKQLVTPSTCELHPKYQALRPPRSKKPGCTCAEIYSRRNEIVERR